MHAADLDRTNESEVDRRFEAFAEAARRAQQTLNVEDALEAGRRWRAFLDMFLPPESPMPRSALRVVK